MLHLYLLRHARSSAHSTDKLRTLDQLGVEQSKSIGLHLNSYSSIDMVKVSDSKRTLQTLENLCITLEKKPLRTIKTPLLYNAPAQSIISEIETTPKNVKKLLIIAHNPGIFVVTQQLKIDFDAKFAIKLLNGDVTAKLVIIKSNADCWENILKVNNKIADVYWPNQ